MSPIESRTNATFYFMHIFSGQFELENLRKEFNKINKEVSKLKRVSIFISAIIFYYRF